MSPQAPFTARLSDGQEWSWCSDCGDAYLVSQPHTCDPLRPARGIVIAIAACLVAYAAVAIGVVGWLWS